MNAVSSPSQNTSCVIRSEISIDLEISNLITSLLYVFSSPCLRGKFFLSATGAPHGRERARLSGPDMPMARKK